MGILFLYKKPLWYYSFAKKIHTKEVLTYVWFYHKFIQSTFIGQKSGEDFYYLVLFGEGNDMQAFRKKYHLSMAQIPFFKNPFHIEKEQFPFLQELL